MANGVFFEGDNIEEAIGKYEKFVQAGLFAITEKGAVDAEKFMRINAPWNDRTTNARNGLRARAVHQTNEKHSVVLFHTMPYGVWLEVVQDGKNQILWPTVMEFGPRLMNMAVAFMKGLKS